MSFNELPPVILTPQETRAMQARRALLWPDVVFREKSRSWYFVSEILDEYAKAVLGEQS